MKNNKKKNTSRIAIVNYLSRSHSVKICQNTLNPAQWFTSQELKENKKQTLSSFLRKGKKRTPA